MMSLGEEADQFMEVASFGRILVFKNWYRALVQSYGDVQTQCVEAADRLQAVASHLFSQGRTGFGASAAGLSYAIRAEVQNGQARGLLTRFVLAKGNMLSYYEENVIELGKFLSLHPEAVAALGTWTKQIEYEKTNR